MRPFFVAACLFVLFIFGACLCLAQNQTIPGAQNLSSVEARRLMINLQQERSELKARSKALAQKERELKTLKKEVQTRIVELERLRKEVKELLGTKKEVQKERAKELSKIYERMEPAKAAATISDLKQDLAIAILSEMRSKSAGEVLNFMAKEKAAELTTAFSLRTKK